MKKHRKIMSYPKAAREPPWRRYVYHHWFVFLEARRLKAVLRHTERPVYLPLRHAEFEGIASDFALRQQLWATRLLQKECELVLFGHSVFLRCDCIERRKPGDRALFYLWGRIIQNGKEDGHQTRYFIGEDTVIFWRGEG